MNDRTDATGPAMEGVPAPDAAPEAPDTPEAATEPEPEAATGSEPESAAEPEPESAAGPEPTAPPAVAPRIPSDALSDRNAIARAKGLPGVLIQGGTDPDPEATRQAERPYVRLLLVMIALIVLGGFVLGFVGMVVGGPAPS